MDSISTWTRGVAFLLAAAGLLLLPHPLAEASGIGSTRLLVDFTRASEAAGLARWSLPDRIRCTDEGLGWAGRKDSSYDATIHVTQALAVGHSWWAATNANITAKLTWSSWDERSVPGHLYMRHSPDAQSWSDWQQLASPRPGEATEHVYRLAVNAPRDKASAWAYTFRRRYYDTKPPLRARTDAALAAWLESKHPGYLARERPFFGYMQFSLDADMRGGRRLLSMDFRVGYVTPGPYGPPRVGGDEERALFDERWNFRTVKHALPHASAERTAAVRSVLSTALKALVAGSGGGHEGKEKAERLLLYDQTAVGRDLCGLTLNGNPFRGPTFEALSREASSDFLRHNRTSRLLPSGVEAGVTIEGTQRDGGNYLLAGGRPGNKHPARVWGRVHNRRSRGSLGLVWVSEPGFRNDGKQAVVHVSRMWRADAGYGRFYVLTKKDGSWKVTAAQETWKR